MTTVTWPFARTPISEGWGEDVACHGATPPPARGRTDLPNHQAQDQPCPPLAAFRTGFEKDCMQFTTSVNSEPVEQALRAFQVSLAEPSPALAEIADDFRAMVTEQFASAGRSGGTPWVALAPSTARRRRAGTSLLNVTGALLASLTDAGAPGHVEETDGQTLTLGSRLSYATYHQTGTGAGYEQSVLPGHTKGQRGLPMRPLIVLTPSRSEQWTELYRQHLGKDNPLLGAKELGG